MLSAIKSLRPLPQEFVNNPPKTPYLPQTEESKARDFYTLVLDLEHTLMCFAKAGDDKSFILRPGAIPFIRELGALFEIVIFTELPASVANPIIEALDPFEGVKGRLYRQHLRLEGGSYTKDLSRLGRDVRKTIILENNPLVYKHQPDNGLFIKAWEGDQSDSSLSEFLPPLRGKDVDFIALFIRHCHESSYRYQIVAQTI
jgi:hypothetical protein